MKKKTTVLLPALLVLLFFSLNSLVAQSALENITSIKHGLKSKRISSFDRSGGNNDRFEAIAPGETRTIAEIEGAGCINHIWITISPEAPKLNRNDIILRIYWDGNDFPSVESPIGPFFGQGWDESYPWASLPLAASPVKGNALVSYFKMPFAKGAKIEIENQADIDIGAFYYYIDYLEQDQVVENLAYFHAWYNQQITEAAPEGENEWSLLSNEVGKNPLGERNYKIINTSGKGHYVGLNYFVNSPTPVWYGEGDDMFFIDGAEKPTLHGTGTEDYFNSSWCPNEKYAHPYFGYAHVPDDIGWLGRTHCYRFHIDDPIYFDKSLLFTIEHGHNNYLTLEMASVAYWYLDAPSKLDPIPDKEHRKLKPVINYLDMHRWRHEWRKNMGNESNPWGNERIAD
jgi:D-arabinan exo alpha-(1,3)/(1,5)-arabinofuranosidase (non-reducing end)